MSLAPVYGADARGQFRAGYYTSKSRLKGEDQSQDEIKSTFLSAYLNGGFTQLNSYADEFTFTLKDRYDSFGKINREFLKFEEDNTAELNEIVYRRPWEGQDFSFSLGRFSLADAGIYRHDGVDLGYRLNDEQRFSIFGGKAPRDSWQHAKGASDEEAIHSQQYGLFWAYEESGDAPLSMTNALARSPTDDFADHLSHTYVYHQSFYSPGPKHHFSNQMNLDLAPVTIIRQAYVSYQLDGDVYQLTSSYQRLAADDYRLLRDIQDAPTPGKRDFITLDLSHPLQQDLFMEYKIQLSRQSRARRDQTMFMVGSRYEGFAQGRMSLSGWLVNRGDVTSKDHALALQLDRFETHYSLHLEQEYSRRRYQDTDLNVNQSRSLLELAFYVSDTWRGATAYSMTHSSRNDISTFYLMLSSSFGGTLTAPTPVKAPDFWGG